MRRYLIVDDNRDFAENLAEIIGDAGHATAIADDGRQALQLAAAERFDAVITDMKMPEVGGADLVRELREVDPQIASIVITAYTTDDDLGRARQYGLLGILPKPAPIPRLLSLLAVARRDALVAVVEDDVALADNVSELLQTHGFATVVASSLQDAQRIGAPPFAAVVDMRMPGGPDGTALARLRERFPGVPVVVVTGHPEVTQPPGTQGFLFKPFNPDALLEAISRLHADRIERGTRA
ncbi:MAG TPA: response regulator [Myxococcales bacterium]|nr:response regulator [Myxococcales bacterium]